jgi:hypothetical protein
MFPDFKTPQTWNHDQDIIDFLQNKALPHGQAFKSEQFKHLYFILAKIKHKLYNPDTPESKFVELVVKEDWDRAYYHADTLNKEGFKYDMFQKFLRYIKQSPQYIQHNRQTQLNQLFQDGSI